MKDITTENQFDMVHLLEAAGWSINFIAAKTGIPKEAIEVALSATDFKNYLELRSKPCDFSPKRASVSRVTSKTPSKNQRADAIIRDINNSLTMVGELLIELRSVV